jgi:hypothetical protein
MPSANSYESPSKRGGNLEQVLGVLSLLEPETTPFISSIAKKAEAKSTFVEVGADTLDRPRRGGTREGTSANQGGNKAKDRARFGVSPQRWTREWSTTDVQEIITKKGGNAFTSDEYAYGQAKSYREIKRDVEATVVSDAEMTTGGESEMLTRGFFRWTSGVLASDNTPGSVPLIYQTPAAMRITGVTDVVESGTNSVNAWLKAARAMSGDAMPYMGIAGLDYIEDIDQTFTGTDTNTTPRSILYKDLGQDRKVDLTVRGFNSSFGRITFTAGDFNLLGVDGTPSAQTPKSLAIYKPENFYMDELFPLAVDEETETGGGKTGRIKYIAALMCKLPKAAGFIRAT